MQCADIIWQCQKFEHQHGCENHGFSYGGEQSGHLIFMDHITSGDGILAALQLLSVMNKQQQVLSELATLMECFPQVLKNVRTETKIGPFSLPGFQQHAHKLGKKLGKTCRILVRASGTEPVIQVMVEGSPEG